MAKLAVGNRVIGKSQKLRGQTGTILQVYKDKRQHSYDVRWDSGVVERVAARGIQPENLPTSSSGGEMVPTATTNESFVTMLTRLESESSSSFDGDSSSSDEEDVISNVSTPVNENLDPEDDFRVHGREWAVCDGVNVDPVMHPPRKTSFRWPEVLLLGERTIIKYFYLFYPMETITSTIFYTNRSLRRNNFGDLQRFRG
jgi:hypothetical protein